MAAPVGSARFIIASRLLRCEELLVFCAEEYFSKGHHALQPACDRPLAFDLLGTSLVLML